MSTRSRSRRSSLSRSPSTLVPLLLLAAAATTPTFTRAQPLPPTAALEWHDSRLTAARQLVVRLEEEAASRDRLGVEATVDPLLRLRDYPGDGTGGEWNSRLGVDATVEFGDPADTRARTLQTLERARNDLEMLELDAITEALLAHAGLLVAQERERDARAELVEAEAELDEAGSPSASLEHRAADLEHREALFELSEARSNALAYGLEGVAVYEPLRFELPGHDVDPRDTHEYRMLRLQLLEAEAELAEARLAPLDDLRLRTGYRLRDIEFELEGGLMNGEPGATLGVDLPGGSERWEFELSAQLVLADDRHETLELEVALDAARAELEEFPQLFRAELEGAIARARFAEEAVDLAEEGSALDDDRAALYRAWIRYLRAVAGVLELSGEEWEVRADR